MFSNWSGDYTGRDNPTTIEITGDIRVTANFSSTTTLNLTLPTNLTAAAGNQQVVLTWNPSAGATSYRVKRATANGGPYTIIASPTSTNYTDTGLTNGTTYYYVVTAVNSGGESGNSNQASATPTGSMPGGNTIDLRAPAFVGYFIIRHTGTITRPGSLPSAQNSSYWVRHDGDGIIQRVDRIGTIDNTGAIRWEVTSVLPGVIWTGRLSVAAGATRASGSGSYEGTNTINGWRYAGTWTATWSLTGD